MSLPIPHIRDRGSGTLFLTNKPLAVPKLRPNNLGSCEASHHVTLACPFMPARKGGHLYGPGQTIPSEALTVAAKVIPQQASSACA